MISALVPWVQQASCHNARINENLFISIPYIKTSLGLYFLNWKFVEKSSDFYYLNYIDPVESVFEDLDQAIEFN